MRKSKPMPARRIIAGVACLALAPLSLLATAPGAVAEPQDRPGHGGRGPEPRVPATELSPGKKALRGTSAPAGERLGSDLTMPSSYPFQPTLRTYPDATPHDAADSGGLIAYDEIAPRLMEWMERSDRISTQVVGESTGGRDLYLVTVTAPESEAETAQQTAWRAEIKNEPASAAQDRELAAAYKTPIWMSSNIHGNEWEGTDASMEYIEELITAPESEVQDLLGSHRLYFSLSLNPDGRTLGTRATRLSLDANRDMITNTSPESVSYVRTTQALQPLYAADLHGYTGVLQVEPCGPPHGENYEYDLFIGHAYQSALRVERDVVAADIPGNTYYNTETRQVVPANTGPETAHIKIPYRDTPSGWDDFPPIFTAQYAAFHGAVANTVELPKRRPSGSTQSPADARINTAVAKQTITSLIDYVAENSDDILANQIEVFRRGVVGDPKESLTESDVAGVPGPAEWKPLWDGADDQDPVELPRAYVIPAGEGQRSASDATRLVEQLLLHDVEVGTLDGPVSVGDTTYPAGSYVVDMHQPLRGMANTLLDRGSDISDKVPSMYDISAWSYSYLWGATVDKVGSTTDAPLGATTPVTGPTSVGSVAPDGRYLSLDLAGVADYQALNSLLGGDVDVVLLEEGSALVHRREVRALRGAAAEFDVAFEAATPTEVAALRGEGAKTLDDLTVAYSGTQDDLLSLSELGFDDLVPVDSSLSDPTAIASADLLWVGDRLDLAGATRQVLQSFVDGGGSVVGRGAAAATAASAVGLLQATPVTAARSSNGIVAVDTPAGGVLAPHQQGHAFVYPAVSFTNLGEGTEVEQTYAPGNPLVAGHWRGSGEQSPQYAGGRPSAISGEAASGARGFVLGTSVFFRNHPKGGMSQAARAIFWAAPEAD